MHLGNATVHLTADDLANARANVYEDGRATVTFGHGLLGLELWGGTYSQPLDPADVSACLRALADRIDSLAPAAEHEEEACPVTDGPCVPVPVQFSYGVVWMCDACGESCLAPEAAA